MNSCFILEKAIKRYNAIANGIEDCTDAKQYFAEYLMYNNFLYGGNILNCDYKCYLTAKDADCDITQGVTCDIRNTIVSQSNNNQIRVLKVTFTVTTSVNKPINIAYCYLKDNVVTTLSTSTVNQVGQTTIEYTFVLPLNVQEIFILQTQETCTKKLLFDESIVVYLAICGQSIYPDVFTQLSIEPDLTIDNGYDTYLIDYNSGNNIFSLVWEFDDNSFPVFDILAGLKLPDGSTVIAGQYFGSQNVYFFESYTITTTGTTKHVTINIEYTGNLLSEEEKQSMFIRLYLTDSFTNETCGSSASIIALYPNGD